MRRTAKQHTGKQAKSFVPLHFPYLKCLAVAPVAGAVQQSMRANTVVKTRRVKCRMQSQILRCRSVVPSATQSRLGYAEPRHSSGRQRRVGGEWYRWNGGQLQSSGWRRTASLTPSPPHPSPSSPLAPVGLIVASVRSTPCPGSPDQSHDPHTNPVTRKAAYYGDRP